MIEEITKASGIPFRETQWVGIPPKGTYGVWLDDVDADGTDFETRIFTHNITLEVYEPKPNPDAERDLERELNSRGLKWTKQTRYWLPDVQRYQTIYDFSYIEKI